MKIKILDTNIIISKNISNAIFLFTIIDNKKQEHEIFRKKGILISFYFYNFGFYIFINRVNK